MINPLKKITADQLAIATEEMIKHLTEINKNQKVLENHLITIQENQVETETYLKEIRTYVKTKR
jgi:hypothetical protein